MKSYPINKARQRYCKKTKLYANILMYADAKISNTILANWIQQYINSTHHGQVEYFLGMSSWFRICKLTVTIVVYDILTE